MTMRMLAGAHRRRWLTTAADCLRPGEVLDVVESQDEWLGGVVERLEQRVDEGERLGAQRRRAQRSARGGELVDPGEAGGRQEVRHQAHRVLVGVVDGQPERGPADLLPAHASRRAAWTCRTPPCPPARPRAARPAGARAAGGR